MSADKPYAEGKLASEATCKRFLQVRKEGGRQVSRRLKNYSLPLILAVGCRERSPRGTQFRQWATAHLEEYLVKGQLASFRNLYAFLAQIIPYQLELLGEENLAHDDCRIAVSSAGGCLTLVSGFYKKSR